MATLAPPWLEQPEAQPRSGMLRNLFTPGHGGAASYGSTSNDETETGSDYESDLETAQTNDDQGDAGFEGEPGYLQVSVEWAEFEDAVTIKGTELVEVIHGPTLDLLQVFLEAAPPPLPPLDNKARARGEEALSEHPESSGAGVEMQYLHSQPRPIVDVRTVEPRSAEGRSYIMYNHRIEFERLRRPDSVVDDMELAQRDLEERAKLSFLERCGQLGQQGLLSSIDRGSSPDVSLDVLDADAFVLVRIVRRPTVGDVSGPGSREVVAQCLVVVDHLRKIAVPDDSFTVYSSHALHAKGPGRKIGQVRLGMRFRHHDADFDQRSFSLLTEALFSKYDTNADGYLTRREFEKFVSDLQHVGGNVKNLEESDNATLGSCLPLPDEDLFSFVKHNHTLFVVCFDRPKYLKAHVESTLSGRLGLVVMSLLWSLSVNCLVTVELEYMARVWQVMIIAIVDNVGKSVMNFMFIIMHLKCWGNSCCCSPASQDVSATFRCCELLPLVVFIVFLGFFSTWLLLAMTPAQLYSSGYSFLPIWLLSRVTEVFYWGTAW